MKKKYDVIIWDWNGTLVDDSWLAVEVMNTLLVKRGLKQIDLDTYRNIFDFPVKEYYLKAGINFDNEPFEKIGLEFIRHYDERHWELQLRNNALETLNHFSNSDKHQYVLSARNQKQLGEEMDYFKIQHYFKKVSGLSHDYAQGKIELGQNLIKMENISIDKAVLIGDTTHDFKVAQSLGIECILIEDGHHSYERLKRCGVIVLKGLDELRSGII
ncbi:MAG: HAD hydrolase-like protein [Bacteroidales bacterium]